MRKVKKIVCFGGSNVVPELILKPLKEKGFDIVGITSMVDSGGSSGELRKEFNVLPAGDIRKHLLALADLPSKEKWKEEIWNFRFAQNIEFSPGHFGHNFANVLITALEVNYGFEKALEICHQFLNVQGKALPATLEKVQLIAELEDGEIVKGEDEIDCGENYKRTKKIKKVFLEPKKAKGYKKAIEEIKKAEVIIIGPGDLYSSIVACFLSRGIKKAIQDSRAKKILICPVMTKLGETHNFTVKDFSEEVEKYIGCEFDFVLYNNFIPEKERIENQKKEEPLLLEIFPFENIQKDKKFIGKNLLLKEGEIKHEPKKVINVLISLFNGGRSGVRPRYAPDFRKTYESKISNGASRNFSRW